MYPRELLAGDVKSKGEEKVFEALRDGSPTTGRSSTPSAGSPATMASGAIDGEIDFVLCHPEKGILCLEVKGGNLRSP